jgi:phosphoribosyl-dephospho-CoA transferase
MVQRHDLVWIDPDLDILQYSPDPEYASFARDWIAQGLPLVVARQPKQPVTGAPHIALGLTLPPPATRQRMSLYVPTEAILRHSGPLELGQSLAHAPLWQDAIQQLLIVCKAAGVTPCVYGSLLWQTVSRYNYLTDTSDLDVLFVCNEVSDINLLVDSLAAFEESRPRLDGEILAPSGWAAAWREVTKAFKAGGSNRVLAKSSHEARLVSLDEFLGQKEA